MKSKYTHISRILMTFTTVLLSLSVLSFTLEFVCLNSNWFMHEYSSHNSISKWIYIDDAVTVTDEMMKYCYGQRDSLDDIKANIRSAEYPDGQELAFFNQREKHHLADCRDLFVTSHKLAVSFLVLSAISLVLIIIKKKTLEFAKVFRNTSIVLLTIVGVVSLIFAINFVAAYDWIHELLFDNYLWILNPATDNLINLMQTDIIVETAVLVLVIWASVTVLCLIAAHSCIHRNSTNS